MAILEALRPYDPYRSRALVPTVDEVMAKERILAIRWKKRLAAKIEERNARTNPAASITASQ